LGHFEILALLYNDRMNALVRVFLLLAFLFHAQAQSPESWRGKTSENHAVSISIVKGAVVSLSIDVGISCANAVDEGTKLFTGPAVPISSKSMKFTGQTTTLCGVIQARLDGTIDGAKASGNLTMIPPKLSDDPAKKKLTWTAAQDVTGK
jgi:hypothetical protein